MPKNDFMRLTTLALFAALFAFGSYISFPLGPLPFTAQSLFILLAGLVLGAKLAPLAVILWLMLGFFGLPVFAGASGGIALIIGPRGGYLIGYVLMAYLAGLARHLPISNRDQKLTQRTLLRTIHLLPAVFSVYAIGLPWLRWRMGLQPIDPTNPELGMSLMSWQRTLILGFWPFLITDVLKAILAALTYEVLFRYKRRK